MAAVSAEDKEFSNPMDPTDVDGHTNFDDEQAIFDEGGGAATKNEGSGAGGKTKAAVRQAAKEGEISPRAQARMNAHHIQKFVNQQGGSPPARDPPCPTRRHGANDLLSAEKLRPR